MNRSIRTACLKGLWLMLLLLGVLPAAAQSGRYRFAMEWERAGLTGLCVVKSDGEGFKGAVVNEFGISYLSFRCDGRRLELQKAVPPFCDRPSLSHMLEADLYCLLTGRIGAGQLRRTAWSEAADGTRMLYDRRSRITFKLKPMESIDR